MISSAKEFIDLRQDNDRRATHDLANEAVWLDIISQYPNYKEWVIHNKTVPLTILRLLAKDADARVRSVVAMKRKCDTELLELLARDSDEGVRHQVACNKKTPQYILDRLRNDASPLVAEAAKGR
jgi:hypothetical protein